MPRRKRSSKARIASVDLTSRQWGELTTGYAGQRAAGCVRGCTDLAHDEPGGCPTHFRDALEAASAYEAFRAEHGDGQAAAHRWAGWWRWVAHRGSPPMAAQAAILAELGELEPWERHELAAWASLDRLATTDTTDAAEGGREDHSNDD